MIERSGVTLSLETEVNAPMLKSFDDVVIATGVTPARSADPDDGRPSCKLYRYPHGGVLVRAKRW